MEQDFLSELEKQKMIEQLAMRHGIDSLRAADVVEHKIEQLSGMEQAGRNPCKTKEEMLAFIGGM